MNPFGLQTIGLKMKLKNKTNSILLGGVFCLLYLSCANRSNRELKQALILWEQKPIVKVGYERKASSMELVIREKDVFTLRLPQLYAYGTYRISRDSIFLNYFNILQVQEQKDTLILNMLDSSAVLKSKWLKPYWKIEILK